MVDATPLDPEALVFGYCGHCKHFETWALGGGGDCRKQHIAEERAKAQDCPDRDLYAQGGGPGFDMSE